MTKVIQVGRMILAVLAMLALTSWPGRAQLPNTSPPGTGPFSPEQLEQILAPVALYPDPLLAQILMAATYPLEIVQADRWLQIPDNAGLRDGSLAAALVSLPWDPSVKSLVPFPQILHMMDVDLTWTEQLGDASLADQAAVMDAVQRLRQRAQVAGNLGTTQQQVVSVQGPLITITPPQFGSGGPEIVYVPVYDPGLAYGPWPYPAFPPDVFPNFFADGIIGVVGFRWLSVGVTAPLWGWGHCDWREHRIGIDPGRFNAINVSHPPITDETWRHDAGHRGHVPYGDAATRERILGERGPAEMGRSQRGYPMAPPPSPTGGGAVVPYHEHEHAPAGGMAAPYHAAPPPPVFESFGHGAEVREQAERGHASRQSQPQFQPPPMSRPSPPMVTEHGGGGQRYEPGGGSHGAPSGGGSHPEPSRGGPHSDSSHGGGERR